MLNLSKIKFKIKREINKFFNANYFKIIKRGGGIAKAITSEYRKNPQKFMFLSFLGRFLVFVYILKTDFKLLKFYKKLNNKSKKSLTILYLFNRNYFICQFENIIFWLSSLEFKEKYQNHHYPPLLNPKKINYEKINAKLAWDLNLPLLKTKFFIYGSHGCGATGFGTFLKNAVLLSSLRR